MESGQALDTNSEPAPSRREAERRFRAAQDVRVVVDRVDGGVPYDMAASLVDLSLNGARICLSCPIRFDERVLIRIEQDQDGFHLSIPGRVRFLRKQGPSWNLGCSFEQRLPSETLDALFEHRILHRRQADRKAIEAQGIAQWEMRPEQLPVDLVDFSPGGFCLRSTSGAVPSSRLVLSLEQPDGNKLTISGRTQWQKKEGDRFLIGCQFTSAAGFQQLLEAVGTSVPVSARPGPSRGLKVLAAAAIAILAAGLAIGLALYKS